MKTIEITLTDFRFPRCLPDGKANFRFVVDLRYINHKGQSVTQQAVLPSPDTSFWECDKEEKCAPNYVRDDGDEDGYSRFDMCAVNDWDKLIFYLKAESVHSIQFKIFDVNREDAWDKMRDFGAAVTGTIFGKITGAFPESLGRVADEIHSFHLKKIVGGGDDKVLFRGSTKLDVKNQNDNSKCCSVKGTGTCGRYKIAFSLKVEQ